MENASKALVIAGGILLAIITLSLIVYMATATQRMGEAQDAKTLAEQIAAFNMEYEAYNKSRMYGTEVITVVNKAIEYNGGLQPKDANKFINIKIKITEEGGFTSSTKTVVVNAKGEITKETEKENEAASLEKETYELKEGTGIKINESVIDFFRQPTSDPPPEEIKSATTVTTIYNYSALTNFKRAIFKCEDVHYNESTGRIDEMTFEQIK